MIRTLTLLAVVGLVAGTAHAQPAAGRYQSPSSRYQNPATLGRPTVSPYLNLFRGGNAAVNYYGLVRPQQEFRRNDLQFRSELNDVGRTAALDRSMQSRTSNLNTTGHPTVFGQNLQGSSQAYVIGLRQLQAQRTSLPEITGSRAAPTGHFSLYGNPGGYFPAAAPR